MADDEHIIGRAWFAIPGAGRAILFVTKPLVAAGLAMATVMWLFLLGPLPAAQSRLRLNTCASG